MILEIDTSSAVPPYEQIRQQISDLAETGVLRADTKLPTIRQLAADLGLANGTVARAYRELEAEGIVTSRVRHGTTVTKRPQPTAQQTRQRLEAAAHTYVQAVRAAGADLDRAISALEAAFANE